MAMWITTIALVSGFMVLSLSGYKMNSEMGLMAAMTIAFAFVLDVVFLPALLLKADVQAARAPETETLHRPPRTTPRIYAWRGSSGWSVVTRTSSRASTRKP